MSQLVKLKAALPSHLIRAQTSVASSAIIGHSQQQRTAHSSTRPTSSIATRTLHQQQRGIATTSKLAAVAASPSQSHSSSSSSSPSSSTLVFGLFGLVVGGAILSTETAHADALAPASELPPIDVASTAGSSAPAKKKAGGRKKKSQRKTLDYPGKLGKLHQAAEQVVNVNVGQGMKVVLQLSAYPPDPLADKAVTIIPMFDLGGPQGPAAQLVASTQLGRKHSLEGYCDTMGNTTGHWKFLSDHGFSVKPSFQLTNNGNMAAVDFDYKRSEQAVTLSASMGGEITSTFNQALTPNLVGGVEFHWVPLHFAHLNGGFRYTSTDKIEQLAISKKDGKFTASYWRQLDRTPHPQSMYGYPDLTTAIGLETSYSDTSKKSDVTVGLKYARQTYNYQVALTSAVPAVQVAYDATLIEGAPNLRWGMSGQIHYDGSGESVIGLNLSINM